MGHYSRSSSRQNDSTDKLHHLGRDIKTRKQNIQSRISTVSMNGSDKTKMLQLKTY